MTPHHAKTVLIARRKELLADLQDIEHDLDEPMPKDWEDRASERQGDEVLEALGESDLQELRGIEAALHRIADGTYGVCVTCGDEISDARLAVLPATPFCKTCAANH
ncbi:transcriptional regulator, TraR/DksA family [Cognatiyoonia koreensis]|uniref:Transcriptional regulator, TraR/DksA family n=1 Tax=Cognatiyoonia koreensis TaxID=364200 RepID=A0A1I0N525_9RHOB|nr:TraR/DksA family transcriptional regulator [Cognatiyoonia koreensis]SEV96210.1 transcriptional regulator, TraR/DksA family [Cognatiyoonia koreensis]